MKPPSGLHIIALCCLSLTFVTFCHSQEIKLYPYRYTILPDIASPHTLANGTEVIISVSASGEFSILPVTQEKGGIYSCIYDFNGKGDQTWIDSPDFPPLGKTGLHSEEQLTTKEMITGRTLEMINFVAKPERLSHSGFIAEDEDIISVLKGDNRTVSKLGMVHSQLAKPLFHIWNAILGEYVSWRDTLKVYYNSDKVFAVFESGNGYQESIFHDEIEGRHNIHIWRELSSEDKVFLKMMYRDLNEDDLQGITYHLSHLTISEMLPFYIMRYGFYEGHTEYRADPVAISVIFGLKSVTEVVSLFSDSLSDVLFRHYTAR